MYQNRIGMGVEWDRSRIGIRFESDENGIGIKVIIIVLDNTKNGFILVLEIRYPPVRVKNSQNNPHHQHVALFLGVGIL
jgi:hypothetical protein